MVTANEIKSAQFEVVKKGYDPVAVDSMLEAAAAGIERLEKAKSELEQQVLLLADKVEEYRADEDKIRATLLGAQKMSDTIIREAKQKGEILLRDATIKSERLLETAHTRVVKEEQALEKIRQEVANFKSSMLDIYRNHLNILNMIPECDDEPTATEPEPVVGGFGIQPEPEPEPAAEPESEDRVSEFVQSFDAGIAEQEDEPQSEPELTSEDFSLDTDRTAEQPNESSDRFGRLDFGEDFTFKK